MGLYLEVWILGKKLRLSEVIKGLPFKGVTLVLKKPPANAGDVRDLGSFPGSERSPGGAQDNHFQYSCLENSKDRGAWWAIVTGVTKSQT